PAYLSGLVGIGFGDGSATRDLSLPDAPLHVKHDVNDTQYLASIEGGYSFTLPGAATLTPFAGITLDSDDQGSVVPNGNAIDVSVQSRSALSARSLAGLRLSDTFDLGGVTLAADLKAGWAHEFSDTTRLALVALGGNAAETFHVLGANLPGDSATVGLGL